MYMLCVSIYVFVADYHAWGRRFSLPRAARERAS